MTKLEEIFIKNWKKFSWRKLKKKFITKVERNFHQKLKEIFMTNLKEFSWQTIKEMFVSKMELTISFSELRSILRNSNCKNVEKVSQRKLKGILWQKLKEMFIKNWKKFSWQNWKKCSWKMKEIFMTKIEMNFMTKIERNVHQKLEDKFMIKIEWTFIKKNMNIFLINAKIIPMSDPSYCWHSRLASLFNILVPNSVGYSQSWRSKF